MSSKRLGKQSIFFETPPSVLSSACVGGKREGDGPLGKSIDFISEDAHFGEKTWEMAERAMMRRCFLLAADKGSISPSSIDYLFCGDLLNQCTTSSFALKDSGAPLFGLYGACSTMAEGLILSAMAIDGGYADTSCAITSSHYCTAERQYRYPLEYGGQKSPTSQWTVTGSGAVLLSRLRSNSSPNNIYITHATTGKIVDAGVNDMSNMGAAMAPSAYDTLCAHFSDTGRAPDFYDMIVTGDLGLFGRSIVVDLFAGDGIDISPRYTDCGLLIYNTEEQDVTCGGSGCGCSATVLAGYLMKLLEGGAVKNLLFAATGALMSPTTSQQGESIPGICHAVSITAGGEHR